MSLARLMSVMIVLLLFAVNQAQAQAEFPNRPIKIVAVVPPGAASDTLARRLGEHVGRTLGQSVIVENRPGAQGAIAARSVAKAAGDGYTLMLGSNTTHAANPYLMKDLGYDPVKDFAPITLLTINPLLLVVNADLPVRSVQDLVRFAKERPGRLNYGTGNTGGLVAVQLLKAQTGIDATGINYPGTAQAATDLVAGRLDFMATDPVVVNGFVQAGKLRILGITSKQRLPSLPDVVSLAEAGLPGYEYASWIGIFGPAGVPVDATRRLNQAFAKALTDPAVEKFLGDTGMISASSSPEQLKNHLQEQIRLWGQWTRDAGLKPL